jgi:hypothetical protein
MAFTSTQNPDGTVTVVIDTGEPYNFVAWLEANVTNVEDLNDFKDMYQSIVDLENELKAQNKMTSTTNGNVITTIYENSDTRELASFGPIRTHSKQYEFRLARCQYNYGQPVDGIVLRPLE